MAKKNVGKTGLHDELLVVEKEKIKEPGRYSIVLHNDDFTTQDFVVHVLVSFLYKTPSQAHALMLKVHLEGKARVGKYTKDIAETKINLITAYSRQHGMPLLVTLEES